MEANKIIHINSPFSLLTLAYFFYLIIDSFFFNAFVPLAFIGVVCFAVIFKFKQIQTGSTGLPPWLDWLFSPISSFHAAPSNRHQPLDSSNPIAASDDDDDDEVSWIDDPIVLPPPPPSSTSGNANKNSMFNATEPSTSNNFYPVFQDQKVNMTSAEIKKIPPPPQQQQQQSSSSSSQLQPPPQQSSTSFFVDFGDSAEPNISTTNTSQAAGTSSHWDKWDDEDSDGWDNLKND